MRYSSLFGKTIKGDPKDEVSVNAKLLLKGGFIDKLMAGSFTILPLGQRVKSKIEDIVRRNMNAIGGQELLMPLLHPKAIWNETGRWDSAKEVMYQFEKNKKEYALSFTHEEIVLDLARKHVGSYKDFPVKVYHFSTKFRNEPRAKSGVLRGREFIMKDLYSLHTSQEDLDEFYWKVGESYLKIFKEVGLEAHVVEAAGGVFTDNVTHEYQVFSPSGEDTTYYCPNCDFAQNKEISDVIEGGSCPKCKEGLRVEKSIEVGNIFRFGTSYSEKMNVTYTDESGNKRHAYLGSYGIGITRLMGTLVEIFHDERGIVWPQNVAPFQAHLVGLADSADHVYDQLVRAGIEVLYDDRNASAGEKFADADLIGIPYRLVVSKKTGDKIEVKRRNSAETALLTLKELLDKIAS